MSGCLDKDSKQMRSLHVFLHLPTTIAIVCHSLHLQGCDLSKGSQLLLIFCLVKSFRGNGLHL